MINSQNLPNGIYLTPRLKDAIEKLIYWDKLYTKKRDEVTKFPNMQNKRDLENYQAHRSSSTRWLTRVYEEETGKRVTQIGNLPDISNEL